MSTQVAAAVAAMAPDLVLLLPLYPQFSTTTTASSLADWRQAAAVAGSGRTDADRLLLSHTAGLGSRRRRLAGDGARIDRSYSADAGAVFTMVCRSGW